jgi:hypothetical protein
MLVVGPAAVIQHATPEVHRGFVLHQMRVHGVAPGEHAPGDEDDVPDPERANLLV